MKRLIIYCAAAVFFTTTTILADAAVLEKKLDGTYEFAAGGNFTLKNYRGDVIIETGDYGAVGLSAVARANCANETDARDLLECTELIVENSDPGDLALKIRTDEDYIRSLQNSGLFGRILSGDEPVLEINCVLTVPREIALRVHTYKGEVSVSGVEGSVEIKDYKGEVIVARIEGDVKAETYKAPLRLSEIHGRVTAKNYKDVIDLAKIEGAISANNYKGAIRAEAYSLAEHAEFDFTTYKDEVVVYFPDALHADLDVRNEKGDTQSDFPLSVLGTLKPGRIDATINGGGVPVKISNYKGSVYLKKL